jgi:enoyl-CoA hydratase/carnithine racemase
MAASSHRETDVTSGSQTMAYETICFDQTDGVAIITLNRPNVLNALNMSLTLELDAAVGHCEENDDIKAIIITGAGEKAFSAGADIHEMAELSPEELAQRGKVRGAATWHMAVCRKPVIGALNGLAYGGGAMLASTFDMRIGCERTRFRFLAATYGRINSTWTLSTIIGMPMAKELLYTGRVVEAQEAHDIGLLNRLVPSTELVPTALELAQMIAQNTPSMVQGIKELLNEGIGRSWEARLEMEREILSGRLKPAHPREGFKEFLDRKGRNR